MPPRLSKAVDNIGDELNLDSRTQVTPKQKTVDLKNETSAESLRNLVNSMRIKAGRTPAQFEKLLTFLRLNRQRDLVDPSISAFIYKLVIAFTTYLESNETYNEAIPAAPILKGARKGLVYHKILTKNDAEVFCKKVIRHAVAKQFKSYSDEEIDATLAQIAEMLIEDPSSTLLKSAQRALEQRM